MFWCALFEESQGPECSPRIPSNRLLLSKIASAGLFIVKGGAIALFAPPPGSATGLVASRFTVRACIEGLAEREGGPSPAQSVARTRLFPQAAPSSCRARSS